MSVNFDEGLTIMNRINRILGVYAKFRSLTFIKLRPMSISQTLIISFKPLMSTHSNYSLNLCHWLSRSIQCRNPFIYRFHSFIKKFSFSFFYQENKVFFLIDYLNKVDLNLLLLYLLQGMICLKWELSRTCYMINNYVEHIQLLQTLWQKKIK